MPLRVGLRSSVFATCACLCPRRAAPRPLAPARAPRRSARARLLEPRVRIDHAHRAARDGPVPRYLAASGRPPERPRSGFPYSDRRLGSPVADAAAGLGTAPAGARTGLRAAARARTPRLAAALVARAPQVGRGPVRAGRWVERPSRFPRLGGRPEDRAGLRSSSRRGLRGGSSTARPVVGGRHATGRKTLDRRGREREDARLDGRASSSKEPGGDLLSQGVSPQVPSARAVLTAVFGMGTGVSPPPWPPEIICRARRRALRELHSEHERITKECDQALGRLVPVG